jgi:hypothetical protein
MSDGVGASRPFMADVLLEKRSDFESPAGNGSHASTVLSSGWKIAATPGTQARSMSDVRTLPKDSVVGTFGLL